jgi:hypothetical protein
MSISPTTSKNILFEALCQQHSPLQIKKLLQSGAKPCDLAIEKALDYPPEERFHVILLLKKAGGNASEFCIRKAIAHHASPETIGLLIRAGAQPSAKTLQSAKEAEYFSRSDAFFTVKVLESVTVAR